MFPFSRVWAILRDGSFGPLSAGIRVRDSVSFFFGGYLLSGVLRLRFRDHWHFISLDQFAASHSHPILQVSYPYFYDRSKRLRNGGFFLILPRFPKERTLPIALVLELVSARQVIRIRYTAHLSASYIITDA